MLGLALEVVTVIKVKIGRFSETTKKRLLPYRANIIPANMGYGQAGGQFQPANYAGNPT